MSESCNYGGGNCGSTPTQPVVTVQPRKAATSATDELSFTGGDVVGFTLVGIGLLAAGIALRAQRPFGVWRDPR